MVQRFLGLGRTKPRNCETTDIRSLYSSEATHRPISAQAAPLYASVTDYTAVYNEGYRVRRGSHTSFDIRVLPPLLASFCREAGISAVLDVSGGQGRLAEALGGLGIDALTTDIATAPGRPVIAFDLSRYSEVDLARVRQEAERAFRGAPHVTSCLDVLEHIDREHLFAAVRNLAGLTARLLVVSISTRPSSRDNFFHASIFPLATWIRVFEIAGFRLLPASPFAPAARRLISGQNAADPLVDRWRAIDLFADTREGEPRYLILERTPHAPDWGAVEAETEALLDVAYRREKRRQFLVPETARRCVRPAAWKSAMTSAGMPWSSPTTRAGTRLRSASPAPATACLIPARTTAAPSRTS